MTKQQLLRHGGAVLAVFAAAAVFNMGPYVLSGVSPAYRQSSDATVHVVDWYKLSSGYQGQFDQDAMFQNYQGQSTGVLVADRALVAAADTLHIGLLEWSIVISWLSLALFLSGVYALAFVFTRNMLVAFVVALVSIVPVISLGLASWGFMTLGFVPKEASLGIALWLTLLYVRGVESNSRRTVTLFFLLLGVAANFYPVLFVHYALILLGAEVLRHRAIRVEQFLFGAVFLLGAPLALYDIFFKAAQFTPPDLAIIEDHYLETLRSWQYLFLHYLRKQIIYVALVGALWWAYRRVMHREYPPLMRLLFAIWLSSLIISLVGVGIELFVPAYTKYLFSRASVWFYFASMIVVGYTAYEICFSKLRPTWLNMAIFAAGLCAVLLAQTSVLNVYRSMVKYKDEAAAYKDYLSVVTRLPSEVPAGGLVLANPDDEAKTVRVYGNRGSWVSWKDGNVTLFDGDAARQWFERYKAAQAAFASKDFETVRRYANSQGLSYYLFDTHDVASTTKALQPYVVYQSGVYGLAKF